MYVKQKSSTPNPYTNKISLLNEQEIRFAGLIDPMGKMIVGDFKKGVKPLVNEADRRKKYMELVLRVSTRKDFDQSLGEVSYSASLRKKVVLLSFPLANKILTISAIPDSDIDKTAKKVMRIFDIN